MFILELASCASSQQTIDPLSAAVIGALVGVGGSFLLTYVRDIYLHSKRLREQQHRAIVQRQLKKLYSPLYQYVKRSEFLLHESVISFSHELGAKYKGLETREKIALDSTIENYMYLAEDNLMVLLPKIHGPAYYKQPEKEDDKQLAEKIAALVISGYEKLRKEYFQLGS